MSAHVNYVYLMESKFYFRVSIILKNKIWQYAKNVFLKISGTLLDINGNVFSTNLGDGE